MKIFSSAAILLCFAMNCKKEVTQATDKTTPMAPVSPVASDRVLPPLAALPTGGQVMWPRGDEESLAEVVGANKAVIVFFRGGWCPKCVAQLKELQDRRTEIKAKGAEIYIVSKVIDEDLDLGADGVHLMHVGDGDDLDTIKAWNVLDAENDIAKPATFVTSDGKIVWSKIGSNPADRPTFEQILAAIP